MTPSSLRTLARAAGLVAGLACSAAALAQQVAAPVGRAPSGQTQIHAARQPQPQSPNAGTTAATTTASPSASGLRSQFPAGLPAPIPLGSGGTNVVSDGVVVDAVPATQVMGAAGGGYARSAPQYVASGSGAYALVDVARSFLMADANRDGELTRAEATRLAIMPLSFEEMDRDHNNILSKSEYEDALR